MREPVCTVIGLWVVQAGSSITWNKGVNLSRRQFCSDLPEILSVFSSPCNEETVPRIKYESNF